MNHVWKTYEDGSEFTTAHAVVTLVAGMTLGTGVYFAKTKLENWIMKKNFERWEKEYH